MLLRSALNGVLTIESLAVMCVCVCVCMMADVSCRRIAFMLSEHD